MAAPGIKISELANYSSNYLSTHLSANQQKLLVARSGDNCQVPLSVLRDKFIIRDFAASQNVLSSSWNFTNSDVQVNNPVQSIDVANGNTLSDLQNIFNRFPTIWTHLTGWFINKYEPNIRVVNEGTEWKSRNAAGAEPKYKRTVDGVEFLEVDIQTGGVNKIGTEGGYWYPEKNLYLDYSVDLNDESDQPGMSWYDVLGWHGEGTIRVKRYEIKASSPVGASFNSSYHCEGSDQRYVGGQNLAWSYETPITASYAGKSTSYTIQYMGGTRYNVNDGSLYRQNDWWGEGMADDPELKGGAWKDYKDAHLSISAGGERVRGTGAANHGKYLRVLHYCVKVYKQTVIISEA